MAESYKVIVSAKAEQDLQDILVYLEEEVGYQTAESIKDVFFEKLNSLESNPSKNSLFRAD